MKSSKQGRYYCWPHGNKMNVLACLKAAANITEVREIKRKCFTKLLENIPLNFKLHITAKYFEKILRFS